MSGCWLWTAAVVSRYGMFRIGEKNRRAHRASWELLRGPIPAGLCVLHHCDNPLCVNPDHLFLGTAIDNVRDRDRKGRQARQRGEDCGAAKLTAVDVRAIRKRADDGETQASISRSYPAVLFQHISRIVRRERWAHL